MDDVNGAGRITEEQRQRIERYLHEQIPLSRQMGIHIASIGPAGVRLAAPLNPNINHRSTAFGGSVSAVAILSAWTLVYARLLDLPFTSRLVIQRNAVEYLLPVHDDFEAFCTAPLPEQWQRFVRALTRRGRARIELSAELTSGGRSVGTFTGAYVASRADTGDG